MKHTVIAKLADVTPSQVANYYAYKNGDERRVKYLTCDALTRIETILRLSKTRLIEMHLEKGARITPAIAADLYDCYSLSQRIGELNRRYERNGETQRIVNLQQSTAPGNWGEYEMRGEE